MRKLVYFIGMTIDGFIAAPDGSGDFFPVTKEILDFIGEEYPETLPTHVREQLGIGSANRRFDTVVMGRVTYEPALRIGVTSPYSPLRQYVVSRSIAESPDPDVEIVSDDPVVRIRELKAEEGKDIYLAGGSRLAGALSSEIDELVIKLYPVVAGAGVPLYTTEFAPVHFALAESRALDDGAVILTYVRK